MTREVSEGSRPGREAWKDSSLPAERRAADLVGRMTIEEKVLQTVHAAAAIERLGVPEYDWWNECLHGVARAGVATVFPQAIGLAATFSTDLMRRVATAISDEARAKHHESLRNGDRSQYTGLTCWSPNVNIFRDPRWGRGQETYGECPHLTARMGVEFCKGLQGDDEKYLKLVATPKHYAVHSGPEKGRHAFDVSVSDRDLWETYLPAFEACVTEARAASVMGAYNCFRGVPCCASELLLEKILREKWAFEGYVVSDCGAIRDIYMYHKVVETCEEARAMAISAGCDLNCCETCGERPMSVTALIHAMETGLLAEELLDRSVVRLFTARFRLGMFDPPSLVPYAQIPYEVNDCPDHRELSLRAARESVVLLKNAEGLLPLDRAIASVAVIGPNAADVEVMLGNYHGEPSGAVTILDGIRNALPGAEVRYSQGCEVLGGGKEGFDDAIELAEKSDVVVMCVGLSNAVEGEECENATGDRSDLLLPGVQEELLRAVRETGKPMIVVLLSGSAVAINWAQEHAGAVLCAWYPGQEGGTAVADVLFGRYNPAGRLPVTFYKSVEQLPDFLNYEMAGRTYRYFRDEPLYPFGFGLSYTSFEYSDLKLSAVKIEAGDSLAVSATVTNTGQIDGDEVVQLYLSDVESSVPAPIRDLVGFDRLGIRAGEAKTVEFTILPRQMSRVDDTGRRFIEPGAFEITLGGGQVGSGAPIVTGAFQVTG